jgi:potassium voltage-gated channel Eag-related subfamily H protein 7
MLIIVLSLINAIYVPVEITFAIETPAMEGINYIMDSIFVIDIIVNFRTIYFDDRTNDPITNTREIAINYILRGRFFVDVVATLPLEFIGDI